MFFLEPEGRPLGDGFPSKNRLNSSQAALEGRNLFELFWLPAGQNGSGFVWFVWCTRSRGLTTLFCHHHCWDVNPSQYAGSSSAGLRIIFSQLLNLPKPSKLKLSKIGSLDPDILNHLPKNSELHFFVALLYFLQKLQVCLVLFLFDRTEKVPHTSSACSIRVFVPRNVARSVHCHRCSPPTLSWRNFVWRTTANRCVLSLEDLWIVVFFFNLLWTF